MAREGIRYTACYSAAPVCSPSRVGLLTGRSPNRSGVYDWIPAAKEGAKRADNRHLVHLKKDAVTIPKLLKKAGYETCLSGKWHCNAMFNSDLQAQPNDAGFDHWFATQNNASPTHRNPVNYVRNGKSVGPLEGFSCQLATDEAITWMKDKGKPGTDQAPFFLFLAFHEPHEPVASPPEMVAGYKDVAENEDQAQYFANVENVDLAVGRILDELKSSGKDENTIVFFTSDNGPETLNRYRSARRSYGSPVPLRGMKLWTTDAGFRVCGIARWPGTLGSDQVIDDPVSSLDLLPTFCELSDISVPGNIDGISLKEGGGIPLNRTKPLVWCYYSAINEQRVAMRHGDWKVLARLDSGNLKKLSNVFPGNAEAVKNASLTDIEIYRISKDIGESENLASTNPEKLEELSQKIRAEYDALLSDSPVWNSVQ
jgi:arylsulfatase A